MAVAGSGGWIPSAIYTYRDGRLVQISIMQNTPKDFVLSPQEATDRFRVGLPARIDVRGAGTLNQVKALLHA